MPLSVLVVIVVVGIALTVIAVHLTGGSRPARIADTGEAERRFLVDYPSGKIESVHVTSDGATAFLPLHGEGVGIVHAVGRHFLTRLVMRSDVASIEIKDDSTLSLRLNDFTWRGGDFTFAEPEIATEMASLLKPALSGAKMRA